VQPSKCDHQKYGRTLKNCRLRQKGRLSLASVLSSHKWQTLERTRAVLLGGLRGIGGQERKERRTRGGLWRPVQRISEAALESFSITKNPPGITGTRRAGGGGGSKSPWTARRYTRGSFREGHGDTREYLKRQTFERAFESKTRTILGRQREILTPRPYGGPSVAIPRITTTFAAVFHASLAHCATICTAMLDPF